MFNGIFLEFYSSFMGFIKNERSFRYLINRFHFRFYLLFSVPHSFDIDISHIEHCKAAFGLQLIKVINIGGGYKRQLVELPSVRIVPEVKAFNTVECLANIGPLSIESCNKVVLKALENVEVALVRLYESARVCPLNI